METYDFTCPECRRAFSVTEPMREATLRNGCPVCGDSVARADFDAQASIA